MTQLQGAGRYRIVEAIPAAAAAAVAGVAALVLVGWAGNVEFLKSLLHLPTSDVWLPTSEPPGA